MIQGVYQTGGVPVTELLVIGSLACIITEYTVVVTSLGVVRRNKWWMRTFPSDLEAILGLNPQTWGCSHASDDQNWDQVPS